MVRYTRDTLSTMARYTRDIPSTMVRYTRRDIQYRIPYSRLANRFDSDNTEWSGNGTGRRW